MIKVTEIDPNSSFENVLGKVENKEAAYRLVLSTYNSIRIIEQNDINEYISYLMIDALRKDEIKHIYFETI